MSRCRKIDEYDSYIGSQEEKSDDCEAIVFDGDLYFSDELLCDKKSIQIW